MDEIKVNDGKGLLDSIGMIDSLIVDCNTLPKHLIDGQYVAFCSKIVEMVQKLSELRKGVKTDTDSLRDQIGALVRENEDLCNQIAEKGVS